MGELDDNIPSPGSETPVEEERCGALEVWLSQESQAELFDHIAALLERTFAGKWTRKAEGADGRSWDLAVHDAVVTLHQEPFRGIFLSAAPENSDMDKANKLVLDMTQVFQDRVD